MRHLWFILMCASLALVTWRGCGPALDRIQDMGPKSKSRFAKLRDRLDEVAAALVAFNEVEGRFPTNEEGLLIVPGLGVAVAAPMDDGTAEVGDQAESYALSGWLADFALSRTRAGVLSPDFLPFIYENRGDAHPDAFEDSPAVDDDRWSVRVADGIYVWSVGGRDRAQLLGWLDTRDRLPLTLGVVMILAFVYLWVTATSRAKAVGAVHGGFWSSLRAMGGSIVVLAALIGGARASVDEERARSFTVERRGVLLDDYRDVIEDHLDEGVLSSSTADRRLKALDRDTMLFGEALAAD